MRTAALALSMVALAVLSDSRATADSASRVTGLVEGLIVDVETRVSVDYEYELAGTVNELRRSESNRFTLQIEALDGEAMRRVIVDYDDNETGDARSADGVTMYEDTERKAFADETFTIELADGRLRNTGSEHAQDAHGELMQGLPMRNVFASRRFEPGKPQRIEPAAFDDIIGKGRVLRFLPFMRIFELTDIDVTLRDVDDGIARFDVSFTTSTARGTGAGSGTFRFDTVRELPVALHVELRERWTDRAFDVEIDVDYAYRTAEAK